MSPLTQSMYTAVLFLFLSDAAGLNTRAESQATFRPNSNTTVLSVQSVDNVALFQTTANERNKFVLLLLEVTGLGMLGIDRMYLGGVNVLLGILKLFTVGGCGLWFVVDYVVLLQNAVSEQPDIDFFGMHYTWQKSTLGPARTVGLVGCGLFLLSCFCSCCGSLYQRKWIPTTKQELLA